MPELLPDSKSHFVRRSYQGCHLVVPCKIAYSVARQQVVVHREEPPGMHILGFGISNYNQN